MVKRVWGTLLLVLAVLAASCGLETTEGNDRPVTTRTSATTIAATTAAPTTTTAVVTPRAREMMETRCGRWDEIGTVAELRQEVSEHPDLEWPAMRDFDGDGYPCEDELGIGYLTADTTLPATTTTSPPTTLTTTTTIATGPPSIVTAAWMRRQCEIMSVDEIGAEITAWQSWDDELVRQAQQIVGTSDDGVWGRGSQTALAEYCQTDTTATTTTITTTTIQLSQKNREDVEWVIFDTFMDREGYEGYIMRWQYEVLAEAVCEDFQSGVAPSILWALGNTENMTEYFDVPNYDAPVVFGGLVSSSLRRGCPNYSDVWTEFVAE